MCVAKFKNAYQERIKLNFDCLGTAGLETPGFGKELSNKKTGRPLATQWRENTSANIGGITDLEKLYRDYGRCISWVTRPVLFHKKVLFRQWEHSERLYIRGIPFNIVNVCTIFRGIRDDEINYCGLCKICIAHCNYSKE